MGRGECVQMISLGSGLFDSIQLFKHLSINLSSLIPESVLFKGTLVLLMELDKGGNNN